MFIIIYYGNIIIFLSRLRPFATAQYYCNFRVRAAAQNGHLYIIIYSNSFYPPRRTKQHFACVNIKACYAPFYTARIIIFRATTRLYKSSHRVCVCVNYFPKSKTH